MDAIFKEAARENFKEKGRSNTVKNHASSAPDFENDPYQEKSNRKSDIMKKPERAISDITKVKITRKSHPDNLFNRLSKSGVSRHEQTLIAREARKN